MVLLARIELAASPLPRECSTTELQQQPEPTAVEAPWTGAAYGWQALSCQGMAAAKRNI